MARRKTHIEKILALLGSGKVDLEFVNLPSGVWGGNNYEDEDDEEKDGFVSITISKKLCLNSKVRALVHESLHILYRSRSEKWVRGREDEVYVSLTKIERKKLEAFLKKNQRHFAMRRGEEMLIKVPLITRIIRLLDSDTVTIEIVSKSRLKKHEWGNCNFSKSRIKIWKKLQFEARLFVLIHECLHFLNPSKDEEWARSRTYQVWGFITAEERQKLEDFLRRHS